MGINQIAHPLFLAIGVLSAQPSLAQVETHRHFELPEHKVGDSPLTFEAGYTADIWRNEGGIRQGKRFLNNVDLVSQLDLGRTIGWKGATAQAYVLYNNSRALTELTGDAQVVSNIETGVEALRLYEAWIDAPLGERARLKVGLYDLNSEFDALETSSLFVGSAHGIGTDISQSGDNGPSIFPVTSLSARLQIELANTVKVRAAVLDGVPGDPSRPSRTVVRLSKDDGALLIGELDFGDDKGRLIAGAWGYTKSVTTHNLSGDGSSTGVYLRGEARLAETRIGAMHGFFRLGLASGKVNTFSRFASGGITLENDTGNSFGLAIAHVMTSDQFREVNPSLGSSETVFEGTYAHRLTSWLEVQPNVQWVINPSADPAVDNALAFGLRFSFGL